MKRRRADLAHLSSYSQEYKTLHQRIKRGSVSWAEFKAKVQAEAAARKEQKRLAKPPKPEPEIRLTRETNVAKQCFADMKKPRIIVSREILRSLGR